MIITIISFSVLGLLLYLSIVTTEKNPKYRVRWMILGCILFFTGSLSLIINAVGLTFGVLEWIELMGTVGSFFFKLALVFGGVAMFFMVNHNPDAYDEYFDGNKYQ